jgi:hypothetical protein
VRSLFQQPLFELFLALDAMAGPRHSVETLSVNFLATMDAFSKAAFPDARERLFYHLQQLALIIALAE